MKRSGLQIAGGVIDIIAGTLWLIMTLFINKLGQSFNLSLDDWQFFMPVGIIVIGAYLCTGRRKKGQVITSGLLNIGVIIEQFFVNGYAGLGIVQIVLLGVAACLLFAAKSPETVITKKQERRAVRLDKPVNDAVDEFEMPMPEPDDTPTVGHTPVGADFTTQLAKLHELLDAGLLTEEEFNEKKLLLMKKMFG